MQTGEPTVASAHATVASPVSTEKEVGCAGWLANHHEGQNCLKQAVRLKMMCFHTSRIFRLQSQLWKTLACAAVCCGRAVSCCCQLSSESSTLASVQAQHGVSWRLARKKVEIEGKQLCLYKSFGA